MNSPVPMIVAFVSGKGGVGKTMLAVAFAKEVSRARPTLIVDLDFFNRGITGLMRFGEHVGSVCRPSFLDEECSPNMWSITQVGDNLFNISYPDLVPKEMQRFENLDVDTLKASLGEFVTRAAAECSCECVVLDCHGGPDNSSFAACLLSQFTLLVSEPDRITLYGTLNFIRQLKRLAPHGGVDLRLIFNKVVSAFSAHFLERVYNESIRQEFENRPLLAIYPLEVYLTKEFEKTPFLTEVYPYSALARKTATLLYDLFAISRPDLLAPGISSVTKWVRSFRRMTLGKTPFILDLNFILATIVSVFLAFALVSTCDDKLFSDQRRNVLTALLRLEVVSSFPIQTIQNDPDAKAFLNGGISEYTFLSKYQAENRDRGTENYFKQLPKLTGFAKFPESMTEPYYWSDRGLDWLEARSIFLSTQLPQVSRGPFSDIYSRNIATLKDVGLPFLATEWTLGEFRLNASGLTLIAVFWTVGAILLAWSRSLEGRLTYYSRQRKYGLELVYFAVILALWCAPSLVLGAANADPPNKSSEWIALLAFSLGFLLVVIENVRMSFLSFRFERQKLEPTLRIIYLCYIFVLIYIGFRIYG
jgi:cellulose biosynthesis protein BcsQ